MLIKIKKRNEHGCKIPQQNIIKLKLMTRQKKVIHHDEVGPILGVQGCCSIQKNK